MSDFAAISITCLENLREFQRFGHCYCRLKGSPCLNGKIAFHSVKGCIAKDYPDGNASFAWERPKNKNEPIDTPPLPWLSWSNTVERYL
jgi:hypothetical protein